MREQGEGKQHWTWHRNSRCYELMQVGLSRVENFDNKSEMV